MLDKNKARFGIEQPDVLSASPVQTMSASPSTPPPPGYMPPVSTGGNLPGQVVSYPPVSTGGNLPATPVVTAPRTGGNLPATPVPDPWTQPPNPNNPDLGSGTPMPKPPVNYGGITAGQPTTPNPQGGFSPANVVQDTMSQLLDPNGAYIRNARQRGIEQAAANGNRAGSTIAAGASQRAALEAAQPLVSEALNLQRQRENLAFQGEQSTLERNRDYTQAQLQDWLSSRSFSRDFYGALTMMPINSAYQLNSMIQSYALENPDVYTADVISGMSNFMTQNFSQILRTYFPNLYGSGSGNGGGG